MLAIAATPVFGAYALYALWRPATFTNYGQLVPPTPVAGLVARQPDGSDFSFAALKGKWVFVVVDSGACDAFCRQKLYKIRQVRLTQGKDMDRIERAWLIDDDTRPAADLALEYQGTQHVYAKGSPLLTGLPAERSVRDHIYVVDPLGNLMMRYPRDADASKMKKDLTRLLRVSRIG